MPREGVAAIPAEIRGRGDRGQLVGNLPGLRVDGAEVGTVDLASFAFMHAKRQHGLDQVVD